MHNYGFVNYIMALRILQFVDKSSYFPQQVSLFEYMLHYFKILQFVFDFKNRKFSGMREIDSENNSFKMGFSTEFTGLWKRLCELALNPSIYW